MAIVQTIVELAAKLGMRTVAAGVETSAQLEQLRRTRCDAVQGFLLAKPMTADRLSALFAGLGLEEDGPGEAIAIPGAG